MNIYDNLLHNAYVIIIKPFVNKSGGNEKKIFERNGRNNYFILCMCVYMHLFWIFNYLLFSY